MVVKPSQTETCESMCWRTVLLCFCGSRLLHHLSQAWRVQQRGTCITWIWKWLSSGVYSYTLTIFTVFCGCENNSHLRSNGRLTSRRTLRCVSLSVWQSWHSAMKVDADLKDYKGKLVSTSLWSDAKCVNLLVVSLYAMFVFEHAMEYVS